MDSEDFPWVAQRMRSGSRATVTCKWVYRRTTGLVAYNMVFMYEHIYIYICTWFLLQSINSSIHCKEWFEASDRNANFRDELRRAVAKQRGLLNFRRVGGVWGCFVGLVGGFSGVFLGFLRAVLFWGSRGVSWGFSRLCVFDVVLFFWGGLGGWVLVLFSWGVLEGFLEGFLGVSWAFSGRIFSLGGSRGFLGHSPGFVFLMLSRSFLGVSRVSWCRVRVLFFLGGSRGVSWGFSVFDVVLFFWGGLGGFLGLGSRLVFSGGSRGVSGSFWGFLGVSWAFSGLCVFGVVAFFFGGVSGVSWAFSGLCVFDVVSFFFGGLEGFLVSGSRLVFSWGFSGASWGLCRLFFWHCLGGFSGDCWGVAVFWAFSWKFLGGLGGFLGVGFSEGSRVFLGVSADFASLAFSRGFSGFAYARLLRVLRVSRLQVFLSDFIKVSRGSALFKEEPSGSLGKATSF